MMDVSGAYAQVIAELDAEKNIKVLYTRGDGIVSREEVEEDGTTGMNFYLSDGHGDVRQLTDETGEVTDSYSYNSFGELKESLGETDNPYLYTGEYYDEGTGLYYLRARYMNPETGTFTSMDTYRGNAYDTASLHRYTYAQNNPQMYNDPSGHFVSTFISGVWRNKVNIAIMGMVNGVINSIVNEVFGGEDKDSTLVAFFKGFAVGAGCAAVYYGVAAIKTLSVVMQVIEVLALSQEVIECASNVVMAIVYGVTGHHTQMAVYFGLAAICFIDILVELGMPGKVKAEGPKGTINFEVDLKNNANGSYHDMMRDRGIISTLADDEIEALDRCGFVMSITNQKGLGGKGWRGDKKWREYLKTIEEGGTIETLDGQIPTKLEAMDLINEAKGIVLRIEGAHDFPNPHNFNHINYKTSSGAKGTIQIQ